MIQRIGITTGGGDAPGLNAVIRAVVKASLLYYHWEVYGIEDGFDGLLQPDRLRILTTKDVSGILPRGGTILGTINRGNPFKHITYRDGKEVVEDITPTLIENIKTVGLDAIICIGGDGTLSIARDLYKKGVQIIGVPKTIDNDLDGTDFTFGFNTAVSTATEALDKLHTTAESHHRAIVMEVMGRDAGWIALEAGISGGADVILIPEIPFDMDEVCRKIKERAMMGSHFSIVVVAEGAKTDNGEKVLVEEPTEKYHIERLGGIGHWVASKISEGIGMETRVTVLGHLQRGGSPTTFDRFLATRFGVVAVEMAAQGKFGVMVCLRGSEISSVPLEEALKTPKRVNPEGEIVKAAEKLGIEFGR
jgi:6-phosphofructokinase 1